jgi:methoxymalonate biosynthesis acyl carrier protein
MKESIRAYIQKNFLGSGKTLGDDDPLFESGVIDSLGHLKLISFLEKEFAVSLSMDDLSWDNFDSVNKIVALVGARKGGV